MKKIFSLVKACMTQNMNLFRINSKSKTESSQRIIPIILACLFLFSIGSYAYMMMEPFKEAGIEILLLTLFVVLTAMMTFIEGIYKSDSLLFNSKDDDLLFSLPIKRETILFIRLLKFYVFELLYSSLFLIPAVVVYAMNVKVGVEYYFISLVSLLLLPIIPIVFSSIIGGFIAYFSSRFQKRNTIQTLLTILILLVIFYFSFTSNNLMEQIAKNGVKIHQQIISIYYPAMAYTKMVMDFHLLDLLLFIVIHLAVILISIFTFRNLYFKVNSGVKGVKVGRRNVMQKDYRLKENPPMKSLMKKEWNRFANTPVLVLNSLFGLMLYLFACILICMNFEEVTTIITTADDISISLEQLLSYIPAVLFGLICFASLMSSITSSMVSLEGKSISVLKSLPVDPFTVLLAKVLSAVCIMLPFIVLGDIILFIKFSFGLREILMLLIASIILPFDSQMIGIIVNLKFPKLDAENDAEVVKQSLSSMIAVFLGIILTLITLVLILVGLGTGISANSIILASIGFFILIGILLLWYLKRRGIREFNMMQ